MATRAAALASRDTGGIRLRFSAGSGPAAAVVRAATWSWCAHVGFLLPDGRVLDATPELGVALRAPDAGDQDQVLGVDAAPGVLEAAVTWARGRLGQPYDWTGALGIGAHRDWGRDGAWFCSELMAAAFKAAGRPLLRTDHLDRVTPAQLLLSPLLVP